MKFITRIQMKFMILSSAMDVRLITLLFLHCSLVISSAAGTNITTDQHMLLALKTHVSSDPHGFMNNWTVSSSVCSWIGVTCGKRHHRVTKLNISSMDLIGSIPPEFGNLSFLVSIDISMNNFGKNLPEDLVRLRRLRFMNLDYNNFTGEIPSWFSSFPQLEFLSLRNNSFTTLNSFLCSSTNGSNLATLVVSFNPFGGEIPKCIGKLHNLKVLTMQGNGFSGLIPPSIMNISSLETLQLSENSLQGIIPEAIGKLRKLNLLNLQGNQLNDSIPLSLFNISTLEHISFSRNKLSGTLPGDMCHQLPMLKRLFASENRIHGSIPSSVSSCSQLRVLSLPHNVITGSIPREIGNLEMLETLYLRTNMLTGVIPSEIGNLHNLRFLSLGDNMLTGSIPSTISNMTFLQFLSVKRNRLSGFLIDEIGNLTMLTELYLGENNFTGVIPQAFDKLTELEIIETGLNRLTGHIPSYIFNSSTLSVISLLGNGFSGNLPTNIGTSLPSLEQLFLGENHLDGVLPNSILNFSQLFILDLSYNEFTSSIPNSMGDVRSLQVLNLAGNNFTSESTFSKLSFFASLTSSKYLTFLDVSNNPLNDILHVFAANSSSLRTFRASSCKIKGYIPNEVGNLSQLVSLYLEGNDLMGTIPSAIVKLSNLQELSLGNNRLSGIIPNGLCKLNKLGAVLLGQNQLKGSIPECLGNASSIRQIYLNSNNLTSSVPVSIWSLEELSEFDISSNSISGSLSSQIGNLKAARVIDMSMNQLSSDIPNAFGGLQSVINLSLANNRFQGHIPDSMGSMLSLNSLNMSHNMLSGTIPKSLESLRDLHYFDVSFNELFGEIPTNGPFKNFTSKSFASNTALCGPLRFEVSPCKGISHHSKRKKVLKVVFIILGIGILLLFIGTMVFIMILYHKKKNSPTVPNTLDTAKHKRISYHELLQATNGYSEDNLLGKGGFGSVYKGVLKDGTILAIKVFNLHIEDVLKSFDAECEVLRNLRHRNLIEVVSTCSNKEFKALVFEYMPNGSLDKWLYSNKNLDIMQRLNIMIDVASALEYLHYGYSKPVVHCDLKPSNVLMDENMVAHVSDFGITKFLGVEESITHTTTFATLGYMAPEYGLEGRISTRCDVYSYGIMLLETFTRKRPSDEMFSGDMNLKNWIEDSLPNSLNEVVDPNLISMEEMNYVEKMCCASSVLELALKCCANSPGERMNMKDALVELTKIKEKFMMQQGPQTHDNIDVRYG